MWRSSRLYSDVVCCLVAEVIALCRLWLLNFCAHFIEVAVMLILYFRPCDIRQSMKINYYGTGVGQAFKTGQRWSAVFSTYFVLKPSVIVHWPVKHFSVSPRSRPKVFDSLFHLCADILCFLGRHVPAIIHSSLPRHYFRASSSDTALDVMLMCHQALWYRPRGSG